MERASATAREPGFTAAAVLIAAAIGAFGIDEFEIPFLHIRRGRTLIANRADVFNGVRLIAILDEPYATTMQATPATGRRAADGGWLMVGDA